MILKLGMDHCKHKVYEIYINDDPGLTVTLFKARSNLVKIASRYQVSAVTGPLVLWLLYTRLCVTKIVLSLLLVVIGTTL